VIPNPIWNQTWFFPIVVGMATPTGMAMGDIRDASMF
jgi:hypothetical protein